MTNIQKLYSIIGSNIKKLRKNLNKTQSVFAEEVGISESFVKQLEKKRDAKGVSLDTLLRIADTYSIDIKYFFNGYK